jgi:hypothetical protein
MTRRLALNLVACAVLTWRTGSRAEKAVSALGVPAIIGAGFNGTSFVDYGHA